MVKRKSARPRRTKSEINNSHYRHLETGFVFFAGDGFPDEESCRAGWLQLRGEILARWIKEHPGTRPWAWWNFNSPERRRRIDGGIHPFDNTERQAMVERLREQNSARACEGKYGMPDTQTCHDPCSLWFGKPCIIFPATDDHLAAYESEQNYLDRLGLLTDEEREILTKK